MPARRRLSAAVSAASALFVLTACEKPAPIVTVYSSGNSEWSEAETFCFEGQSVQEANCASRADEVKVIEVTLGEQVAIDLSKEAAERDWFLQLGEAPAEGQGAQPARSQVFVDGQQQYFAFRVETLGPEGRQPLVIRTVESAESEVPTGEWRFLLVEKQ